MQISNSLFRIRNAVLIMLINKKILKCLATKKLSVTQNKTKMCFYVNLIKEKETNC